MVTLTREEKKRRHRTKVMFVILTWENHWTFALRTFPLTLAEHTIILSAIITKMLVGRIICPQRCHFMEKVAVKYRRFKFHSFERHHHCNRMTFELQKTSSGADILIHMGFYTCYGKHDHVLDFNAWLGELGDQYTHKLVVHGNHDCDASWKSEAKSLLSNETILAHKSTKLEFKKPHNNQGKEHEHTTATKTNDDFPTQRKCQTEIIWNNIFIARGGSD